jgi:hypothetical protein
VTPYAIGPIARRLIDISTPLVFFSNHLTLISQVVAVTFEIMIVHPAAEVVFFDFAVATMIGVFEKPTKLGDGTAIVVLTSALVAGIDISIAYVFNLFETTD